MAKAEFLKKRKKLPCFPYYAVREAKKKFPVAYTKLRNRFKNDSTLYQDCKFCLGAGIDQMRLMQSLGIFADNQEKKFFRYRIYGSFPIRTSSPNPGIKKYGGEISAMPDVLVTEDFLKEIFGEIFWSIPKHCNKSWFESDGFSARFGISPCNGGFKFFYRFENSDRGNRREDVVPFASEDRQERLDFNYVESSFAIRKKMKFPT